MWMTESKSREARSGTKQGQYYRGVEGGLRGLSLLLLLGLLASGCTAMGVYTLRTTKAPARDLPDAAYGLSLGESTQHALVEQGWVLAEQQARGALWVSAVSDAAVRDVEASTRDLGDSRVSVELIRTYFQSTRWTTYERLLKSLVAAHGQPQSSVQSNHFEHFSPGSDLHRVRPSRFVVHTWEAEGRKLVLVGGIEAMENMLSAMEYQLLLIRSP